MCERAHLRRAVEIVVTAVVHKPIIKRERMSRILEAAGSHQSVVIPKCKSIELVAGSMLKKDE